MISIIIPVLNEENTILKLLEVLSKNASSKSVSEIIVVDGGSKDDTISLLENYSSKNIPLIVLTSRKGRALQMNTGAKKAKGSILYFLHADTLPPFGFDTQIVEAIREGLDAGCFRMKFDSLHPILKFSQWFTRFNHQACRGGDQSLFIKKSAFDQLQGYNEEFEIYEDCEFINRIYSRYRFGVLKDYVITSSRRYQKHGTLKLQYHFTMIHLKKWLGASPIALSNYYQKHIAS